MVELVKRPGIRKSLIAIVTVLAVVLLLGSLAAVSALTVEDDSEAEKGGSYECVQYDAHGVCVAWAPVDDDGADAVSGEEGAADEAD